MKLVRLMIAAVMLVTCAAAQQMNSVVQPSPEFEKLKTLAGDWEGTAMESGKAIKALTSFKVVSDGSAVINRLDPDSPNEMITMFHPDGKDLMATHYCSAHNQPRLRAVASNDPKAILFEFKDATNLASPKDGHMDHLKILMIDPDHHIQEWTYVENGKQETGRFEFHRKK